MKRSEMVEHIAIELMGRLPEGEKQYRIELANEILLAIEVQGMLPPKVKAADLYPDKKWGACCTMRCDCADCNPNFPVHEWEKE